MLHQASSLQHGGSSTACPWLYLGFSLVGTLCIKIRTSTPYPTGFLHRSHPLSYGKKPITSQKTSETTNPRKRVQASTGTGNMSRRSPDHPPGSQRPQTQRMGASTEHPGKTESNGLAANHVSVDPDPLAASSLTIWPLACP